MTAHLSGNLDQVESLARRKPLGLLLDLDGTLSELGPDPEASTVTPAIVSAIGELQSKVGLVAVITGRSVAQAVRIIDLEGVIYVGNHGLERLEGGSVVVDPRIQPYLGLLATLLEGLRSQISIPGVYFEDNGSSFAIHFRNANDPVQAGLQILKAIDDMGHDEVALIAGKQVINILPPVELNKGTAVANLVEKYALSSVIYIGDDVTDLDAFRKIAKLVRIGKILGLCVGVAGEESPDAISSEADYVLSSVAEVGWFLDWMAIRLS